MEKLNKGFRFIAKVLEIRWRDGLYWFKIKVILRLWLIFNLIKLKNVSTNIAHLSRSKNYLPSVIILLPEQKIPSKISSNSIN